MVQAINLEGKAFGRLSVLSRAQSSQRGKARWHCRCVCGNEVVCPSETLRDGRAQSCGCRQRERASEANRTHGATAFRKRSREYRAWIDVRRRCFDEKHGTFAKYGARGIGMHEGWRDDFGAFLSEIGPAPSERHTVDRIDNAKGYEPGNVRWATQKEQMRNLRKNVYVWLNGERMLLAEACEKEGVNYYVAYARLRRGACPFP